MWAMRAIGGGMGTVSTGKCDVNLVQPEIGKGLFLRLSDCDCIKKKQRQKRTRMSMSESKSKIGGGNKTESNCEEIILSTQSAVCVSSYLLFSAFYRAN